MKIEVIEIKPVDPPKEYLLRINQDELNLISALVGRTYRGPDWVIPLYEGLIKHTTKEAEDILSDKDYDGSFKYTSIGLKND